MPELPDISVYAEALAPRLVGRALERAVVASPFLVRTTSPPLSAAVGRSFVGVRRLGKQIVLSLEGSLHLVLHLKLAGRLHWRAPGARPPGRNGLAAFGVADGTLVWVEYGTKRRASLHVVEGDEALAAFDRGGVDPLTVTGPEVAERLRRERHTLKRALTDPRWFDGIGGAWADEILFAARLPPLAWSDAVDDAQADRLAAAMREVLAGALALVRTKAAGGFPEKVTAFHEEMAVHGRADQPCRVCGNPVQRIVTGDRETCYCAACQNGGRLYKDRALSRLLHDDWPETLDELAAMRRW